MLATSALSLGWAKANLTAEDVPEALTQPFKICLEKGSVLGLSRFIAFKSALKALFNNHLVNQGFVPEFLCASIVLMDSVHLN